MTAAANPAPLPDRDQPAAGARTALILLIAINLFNFIDRNILAAVEPEIRKTYFPGEIDPATGKERVDPETGKVVEPEGSRFWMGMLGSAFLVSYIAFAPLFGYLANRTSRWLLVAIGVILWSLASGASGLAATFLILFLTRCLVGIGEAVYGPVAPDMLSDLYPVRRRGAIMAWFYAAIPVGGAIGYAVGDFIVKQVFPNDPDGWRWAFYAVVPPGLLLGAVCFWMPEPRRGQVEVNLKDPGRKETWADYLILFRTPSYVLNLAGMTLMTFAIGGLAFWAADYIDEYRKAEPLFGVPPRTAFGLITAVTGLAATLLGGWAGDRLRGVVPGSYFFVSGAAMVLACPMLLLVIWTPFPWAWLPLAAFVFLLFFNTGPANTITANVAHPLLRAPAFGLLILISHLLGDVISPPLMGWVTGAVNRAGGTNGQDWAFGVVAVSVLLGGVAWLWGMRYLDRDTELAPTRIGPAA